MKVLALSSRTDVVADDFEISLNDVIRDLSDDDKALIHTLDTHAPSYENNTSGGACPMHQMKPSKTLPHGVAGLKAIRHVTLLTQPGLHDILIDSKGR
jgi:hypothetical protein